MGGVFNYVNLHVYHYAGNNPVKYVDPDGNSATVFGAVIGAIGGAAKGLAKNIGNGNGLDIKYIGMHAALGAAKGATVGLVMDATVIAVAGSIASGGIGAVGGVAIVAAASGAAGALTGAVSSIVEQKYIDNKTVDLGEVGKAALIDGAFSTVGGGMAGMGAVSKGFAQADLARMSLVPGVQQSTLRASAVANTERALMVSRVGDLVTIASLLPDANKLQKEINDVP
jgi:hypothetical protein